MVGRFISPAKTVPSLLAKRQMLNPLCYQGSKSHKDISIQKHSIRCFAYMKCSTYRFNWRLLTSQTHNNCGKCNHPTVINLLTLLHSERPKLSKV